MFERIKVSPGLPRIFGRSRTTLSPATETIYSSPTSEATKTIVLTPNDISNQNYKAFYLIVSATVGGLAPATVTLTLNGKANNAYATAVATGSFTWLCFIEDFGVSQTIIITGTNLAITNCQVDARMLVSTR